MKMKRIPVEVIPNKYDKDFYPIVEALLCEAFDVEMIDPDELEMYSKVAAQNPLKFQEFIFREKELREETHLTNERLVKAHKAKTQKLRRQAKSLGIKNWSGLWDELLTASDVLRMERICDSHKWELQISVPKFQLFPSEDSEWEILMDGLTTVTFSPLQIKLLLDKAVDDDAVWPLIELTELTGKEILNDPYVFRSTAQVERCLAGYRWLTEFEVSRAGVTPRFARTLMRLPETYRWAALSRYDMSLPYPKVRKVNWKAIEFANKNPAFRFECLAPSVQWERLFGFKLPTSAFSKRKQSLRTGLFGGANQQVTLIPLLTEIKPSVVRKVCAEVKLPLEAKTFDDNWPNLSNLVAILNLAYLFKDVQAIKRFVAASGHPWTIKGLHDSGQFSVPVVLEKHFTPETWAPLCLRHPEAVTFAGSFGALEDKNIFPTSLAQLRREVRGLEYPDTKPEWTELRNVCLDAGVSSSQYLTYEKFWGSKPQKTAEFMPQAKVCGTEVGLDSSWAFFKLSAYDYRGPLLGLLTGCCQHLDGAGRASAEHGVRSPYSGFYVVTHGKKVILQSWAWRTTHGDVVLDSIESINRIGDDLEPAFKLLEKGLERIAESPLGVKRVFVGATDSGVTGLFTKRVLVKGKKSSRAKQYASVPQDDCAYFDGRSHFLVVGSAPPARKRPAKEDGLPEVVGYTTTKSQPMRTAENFGAFLFDTTEEYVQFANQRGRDYAFEERYGHYRAMQDRGELYWATA